MRSISHDILGSRPLWGMLRLNEYLETEDPLYRAYRTKAREAIATQNYSESQLEIIEQVLATGARLQDLTPDTAQQLKALISRNEPRSREKPARSIPAPGSLRTHKARGHALAQAGKRLSGRSEQKTAR